MGVKKTKTHQSRLSVSSKRQKMIAKAAKPVTKQAFRTFVTTFSQKTSVHSANVTL
jgi:hypothetical protein